MSDYLFSHWGKADFEDSHPAVLHMIDVAVTADAMLGNSKSGFLKYLSRYISAEGKSDISQWIAFIAALHDLGKISPGFQNKRADLVSESLKSNLKMKSIGDCDHCEVTYISICDSFGDYCRDIDTCEVIAYVLSAHHGSFKLPGGYSDGEWKSERESCIEYLADLFCIEGRISVSDDASAAMLMLAGLISVADWIASDDEYFPYHRCRPEDIRAYMDSRGKIAEERIRELHLAGGDHVVKDFEELFGFSPNSCQREVIKITDQLSHPMLLIVESPMGSGKTEASFAAYSSLISRSDANGMYYGLPTQATGNLMFERVEDFIRKTVSETELHLIHANSDLNDLYRQLRLKSVCQEGDGGLYASHWFTSKKRGLLGGYGVGTVDQALLSVMRVRHMFVRLFGLSGKVVILDEIHAYDVYTGTIIENLIKWLSICGSSVILLSATLPQRKKLELIKAFNSESEPPGLPYPSVYGADSSGDCAEGRFSQSSGEKPIIITPVREDEWSPAAVNDMPGCTALIVNTVKDAQRLYREVKEFYDGELMLFHSRFTLGQRLEIERRVKELYGKRGDRPVKGLLIATQVVEQSLDLDFDNMITWLCPMDLLLQRAGRLQRHKRERRVSERRLTVITPELSDRPDFRETGFVYDKLILLKTALLIRNERVVKIPDDIPELIESVYSEETDRIPAYLMPVFEEWQNELDGKSSADRFDAVGKVLPDAKRDRAICVDVLNELAYRLPEEIITTRNGRESANIAIMYKNTDVTTKDDALHIYKNSVKVSDSRVVRHFYDVEVPDSWGDFSVLRGIKPALMNDGEYRFDKYTVRYDPELGLLLDREAK